MESPSEVIAHFGRQALDVGIVVAARQARLRVLRQHLVGSGLPSADGRRRRRRLRGGGDRPGDHGREQRGEKDNRTKHGTSHWNGG